MAYFSNGTEGMIYQSQYCDNCVHGQGSDCPIWALHLMFNSHREIRDNVLIVLIPEDAHGLPEQCSMFIKIERENHHQMKLFEGEGLCQA